MNSLAMNPGLITTVNDVCLYWEHYFRDQQYYKLTRVTFSSLEFVCKHNVHVCIYNVCTCVYIYM